MALRQHRLFRPAAGALLTAGCGLVLWGTSLGDSWVNFSYDYLFRFNSRSVTTPVVIIKMDNEAYDSSQQNRKELWDRGLHAELLNRLANDGCRLVVFDARFYLPG